MGAGQNGEPPIFRKFETSNIEIKKVELFDFSILFEHSKYIFVNLPSNSKFVEF